MAVKIGWKRFSISFLFLATLCVFYWLDLLTIPNVVIALLVSTVLMILAADGLFEKCYVLGRTLPRGAKAAKLFVRFRLRVFRYLRNNGNIPAKFQEQVRRHPNGVCFIADGRRWTYTEVNELSSRVASVFHEAGFVHGDVVSLFMESTPEFVCIWLGLARLGVITALVNNNLRFQSLTHVITTVNSKALIFSSNLGDAVAEITNSLPEGILYYHYGNDDTFQFARSLTEAMQVTKPDLMPSPSVALSSNDRLLYISTSGTTGLPKAAVITNTRYYFLASALNSLLEPNDVYYGTLPLYHMAGGIMGVGQALCFGVPVVIKKKFSASQFWSDCIQYNCTVSQYMGEMCRYLLTQPPTPQDGAHSIRLMVGAGLRAEIWEPFVHRFAIPRIVEVYGSTEGNANIVNIDGKVGAVGFIPNILSSLLPCALIKVDETTGIPLRNDEGLCIKCDRGEVGELVGKIINTSPDRRFDGYVDQEATSRKIYSDVFKKGDQAFASGDIMITDRFGYLYFKDRAGDTFRWKSENVSTTEVEAVITNAIGLNEVAVYGVKVPNCEGRAGMAAIVDPSHSLDLDKLCSALVKNLPSYARPVFIRITDSLPMTATYRMKKFELQKLGFDTYVVGQDVLYYLNGDKYSILTPQVYDDIYSGKIRY